MAKVGGLGEAVAGLIRSLQTLGLPVELIMPDYGNIVLAEQTIDTLNTPAWVGDCWVRRGDAAGFGPICLIGTAALRRSHPYTDPLTDMSWPDNDVRFFGFSAGVAALIDQDRPDLVHVHDWHGAAAILLARHRPATVLTIHNLAHHGLASPEWSAILGPRSAPMILPGQIDPLVGAIRTADAIITVSPNYRHEICTTAGEGIAEILCVASPRLHGILNGIDQDLWNPLTDPRLPFSFDRTNLSGKKACRHQLQQRVGGLERRGPIIAMVARMTEQKGIDLALQAASTIAEADGLLLIHGEGQRALKDQAHAMESRDRSHVVVLDGYDETTAHRLIGGSDMFLMPSRFEPCGLTQLQAMTYGTIPIVTDVGGLHDTVIDTDHDTSFGTGFVASEVTARAIIDATKRAIAAWRNHSRWSKIQHRAMGADWSWRPSATEHIEIYRGLIEPGVPAPVELIDLTRIDEMAGSAFP